MKIVSRNIGRIQNKDPENILIQDYKKRIDAIGKNAGLSGFDIIEYDFKKNLPAEAVKQEEAKLILSGCEKNDVLIALDERGKNIDSIAFSQIIQNAQENYSKNIIFVIGGAHGLDSTVRQRANHIISFGKMTMPHKIARILLVEQIYRSLTILNNHPYHKV